MRYHAEPREPGNEKAKKRQRNEAKVQGVYTDTKLIDEGKMTLQILTPRKTIMET
jgi:hypothetical protein